MVPYSLMKILLLEFLRFRPGPYPFSYWALTFFLFILTIWLTNSPLHIYSTLFADDTKVARYAHDKYELQNALNKLASWVSHWKLGLATHKCEILTFGKYSYSKP